MNGLAKKYFSKADKIVFLQKGDYLFRKGEQNNHLYLLQSGRMKGFDPQDQGVFFEAESGDFIGLHSFFSLVSTTRMSVVALEDSVLPYISKSDFSHDDADELNADFMPAVIFMMIKRQEQAHQASLRHQKILEDMQEVERLASLGQLSAGVAHELNNAITVISRGSDYIIKQVLDQLKCNAFETEMINAGLSQGRYVSSAEARKVARDLKKLHPSFSDAKLRDYARTGMGERLASQPLETAQRAFNLWNLGASLHDLQLAVQQSEHVINSMRSLASTNVIRQAGCDINGSIRHAVSLLSNPLKKVSLELQLGDIPPVFGNSAELVQIWTNIMKNAADAMSGQTQQASRLSVKTDQHNGRVRVQISDSGPGIPDGIVDEIFKPHVTTKKTGQTFGLGLGLTIVEKIVKRYDGDMNVDSSPQGTTFTVTIPIGANA